MRPWVFFPVFVALLYLSSFASVAAASEKNTADNWINQNIRVVLDHIFISKNNGSLEVTEVVVFRNEGPEIYYSKDNHTFFAISIPPDAKALKTEAMECCLVEEEGLVLMDPMQSIMPGGSFEMKIFYALVPQGQEYVFNKSTMYDTTSLSVFIDRKGGMSLEGPYETVTLRGSKYDTVALGDLKARETIHVPVKMAGESGYLYAGIGLFSLLLLGTAYRFRGKLPGRRKEKYTLEELELEKRKLFQALYGFEKHAGDEGSEEYRGLVEEYRQRAIQVLIKMDELKKDRPV